MFLMRNDRFCEMLLSRENDQEDGSNVFHSVILISKTDFEARRTYSILSFRISFRSLGGT